MPYRPAVSFFQKMITLDKKNVGSQVQISKIYTIPVEGRHRLGNGLLSRAAWVNRRRI